MRQEENYGNPNRSIGDVFNDSNSESFEKYKNGDNFDDFSSMKSNQLTDYNRDNEENANKIVYGEEKALNSFKSFENKINSPHEPRENPVRFINLIINDPQNYNEEDLIINYKKEKIKKNHEKERKKDIEYEIENDKTKNQSYTNSVKKTGFLFNIYKGKTHDKEYNDNKVKKLNAFLINGVARSHGNKIIKKLQESKKNPESNSLKKKKNKTCDKIVQINGEQFKNTHVNFCKELLNYSIKDALSFPISNKYKNKYSEDHNIIIIEKYYNEYEKARQFFDIRIEDFINYLNDGNNSDKELMDTYKEKLAKRNKVKKKIKIL